MNWLPDDSARDRFGQMISDTLAGRMTFARSGHMPTPHPKNDAELYDAMVELFGVHVPNRAVCDTHVAPFRAFADAYFARYHTLIIKASRGFGGKSYLLGALGLAEASFLGADVNILGGTGSQSRNVLDHMTGMWEYPNAPKHLIEKVPSLWYTQFKAGNQIIALTASQGAVRGPHPQRLRLDEVDEMPKDIFDAALGQPMESRGVLEQTVISSTHQYVDGTMSYALERAKDNGWPVYEWCYRESAQSWLSEAQIERKKQQVSASMWEVEYELQRGSFEGIAILPEKVALMFDKKLGTFAGDVDEYVEIERPISDATYVHGADWAKDLNFTCIITMRTDVRPIRLVAFERSQRLPWPLMVDRFNRRVKQWGGASAHDATGVGNVVHDFLEVEATGLELVGKTRSRLFSDYVVTIENDGIIAPDIEFMRKEHERVRNVDLYGTGHPPDSFVAGACALFASGYGTETTIGTSPVGNYRG